MRTLLVLFLLAATLAGAQPLGGAPPRTVPLPRNDYLTFIHPDAQAVIGFDFKPVTTLIDALISEMAGPNAKKTTKGLDGMKELDRVWISIQGTTGAQDVLVLMTGHFERGALAAELTNAPGGFARVFLGGPNVMLAGPEASVKAALVRLSAPGKEATLGWAAEQAREFSTDHDFWIAAQPGAELQQMAGQFGGLTHFVFGAKLHNEASFDGEFGAVSDAIIDKMMVELEATKAKAIKENPKMRALLEKLAVERDGMVLRFSAQGGKINPKQFASELSKQVRTVMSSLLSGGASQQRAIVDLKVLVPDEKLEGVKKGMTRDEVTGLLGKPVMVSSISGLDVPRESWTYHLASGKKVTLRLDDGVVSSLPRP